MREERRRSRGMGLNINVVRWNGGEKEGGRLGRRKGGGKRWRKGMRGKEMGKGREEGER